MSKLSSPQAKRRSRADLALDDDPFEDLAEEETGATLLPAARLRHFYHKPAEDSRPTRKQDRDQVQAAQGQRDPSRKRGDKHKEGRGGESAGHRGMRLTHLLSEELAFLFENEVADPNLRDLQIVEVDLSVDYRNARVIVCPRAPEGNRSLGERLTQIEEAIARADGFLRRRLLSALDLKHAIALNIKVRATP